MILKQKKKSTYSIRTNDGGRKDEELNRVYSKRDI